MIYIEAKSEFSIASDSKVLLFDSLATSDSIEQKYANYLKLRKPLYLPPLIFESLLKGNSTFIHDKIK